MITRRFDSTLPRNRAAQRLAPQQLELDASSADTLERARHFLDRHAGVAPSDDQLLQRAIGLLGQHLRLIADDPAAVARERAALQAD